MPVMSPTAAPPQEDRLYTWEEFLRMDFDESVELVEGRIVRMGWNNETHAMIIAWLIRVLGMWAERANWGWILGGDAGILTKKDPDTTRGADLIGISFGRHARISPERKGKVVDVGPELIVEVVSPSNTWDDIQTKLAEYFALGTNEIWVVGPNQKAITVYTAIDQPRVFTADKDDVLTSIQLPEFELRVGEMGNLIDKLQAS